MSDSKTNVNTGSKMHMFAYKGAYIKDGSVKIRRRVTGQDQTACKRWITGLTFGDFQGWHEAPEGCEHCKREWNRIADEIRNLQKQLNQA